MLLNSLQSENKRLSHPLISPNLELSLELMMKRHLSIIIMVKDQHTNITRSFSHVM